MAGGVMHVEWYATVLRQDGAGRRGAPSPPR